jgi:hypothetical protein
MFYDGIPLITSDFLVDTETIASGRFSAKTAGTSSSIFAVKADRASGDGCKTHPHEDNRRPSQSSLLRRERARLADKQKGADDRERGEHHEQPKRVHKPEAFISRVVDDLVRLGQKGHQL